ncbi:MAG: hypothetical protein Q4P28_03530 [Tissierellia bacterium]|nr:hypothetical protein [Tissierellia bacterium]
MIIREDGRTHEKKLLFFPGGFSDYQWYRPSIEKLSENYHVFSVIYDGYYEPFEPSFPRVEQLAEKVIRYFEQKNHTNFDIIYGFCLGGSIANLIYASGKIATKTLIVDAGIMPYELPYFITRIILLRDVFGMKILRRSKTLIKTLFPPERWLPPGEGEEEYYDEIYKFLNHLSSDTIKNGFDSCNNYKIPDPLPVNDTKIYYLYGELEKKARAWDMDYFKKIYPDGKLMEIPDCEHGEFCMMKSLAFRDKIKELAMGTYPIRMEL